MMQGVIVRGRGGFYTVRDEAGQEFVLRAKKKFFLRSVKEEPHIESNYLHMCKDLHVPPAPAGCAG